MAEKKKYTVVIPLFNKSSTIDRSIDSVLAQGHDVEIIIVDDGSTDDGVRRVLARNDPSIRLIQQTNQGVSSARNAGIFASKNELVALLDADDEWQEGFLDTIDALVEEHPNAGAYTTSFVKMYSDGARYPQNTKIKHPYAGVLNYFHCARYGDFFNASSIVVRREAMQRIDGFNPTIKIGEDYDAWGRLALLYPIAHDSQVKVIYHFEGKEHATYLPRPITESFIDHAINHLSSEPVQNDDLMKYVDFLINKFAWRNIFSGYPAQARHILKKKPVQNISIKRSLIFLLTFVPTSFILFVRAVSWKIRT